MYSAAPADWANGNLLRESYHSAEMQSVYSAAPVDRERIERNVFAF